MGMVMNESGFLSREAWLGNFQGISKCLLKGGGLIDYVASSFLGLPFVEVADDDSQAIRAARTVPGNITQPLTKFSKARARFPVL